jgi:hypothetical protein
MRQRGFLRLKLYEELQRREMEIGKDIYNSFAKSIFSDDNTINF